MAKHWARRLIGWLGPPSRAASMEGESPEWVVRCRSCGLERPVWELGGIRWKPKGSRLTWTWGRCPDCGQRRWHTIHRRDHPEPTRAE